ncbi:hypothetical protein CAEBREN_16272 [Caenorhabditis brenneri]|uniref:Uncharacterized protein n=1 Tax=Caenorhabditis brenneri TaxID=135651 RepID=G0NNM1_CAEBE|nr:hypothetical protein CAEBREN_16272 [Caenorhabditis brenneri]
MNTAQAYGQRLHPVQESGIEKTEPLLSIQQTPIDHSMDVMIDSSRLVMDTGVSPAGSIEHIFTRLTRRLVFEFLGGHAIMEELPCLGDLADGNDEFHRITPSPAFSKSSQFKLLDSTGHLHPSSIAFMDSGFNPRIEDYLCESVLLDSYDASSTTFISSLEQFLTELISQPAEQESHQCSPISNIVDEKIAGLMAESLCDSVVSETQVFMKSDGFSNGINLMRTPIPISSNQSDKEHSETSVSIMAHPKDDPNILDMNKILPSEIYKASVNASNEQIQKTLSHLAPNVYSLMYKNRHGSLPIKSSSLTTSIHDGSTMNNNSANEKDLGNSVSSNHNNQSISDSSNTELLETHCPTVVESSSFDVSDHEELLESYGFNNQDQTTDGSYTCASHSWPGKVDAAWKEAIQMNLTDLASNEDSLSSFYDGNSKNSVSSTHLEQRK